MKNDRTGTRALTTALSIVIILSGAGRGLARPAVAAPADPTASLLAATKKQLRSLQLRLAYYGDKPGGNAMPGLLLHVAAVDFDLQPNWEGGRLTPEAANKLLEGLAADGFFRNARAAEGKFAEVGYVLHLETNGRALHEVLGEPSHLRLVQPARGHDPDAQSRVVGARDSELLARRLTMLHRVIEGAAKKSFDRFLAKLITPAEPEVVKPKANSNALVNEYKGELQLSASSAWPGWGTDKMIDGAPETSWFTVSGDSAGNQKHTWIEVRLPADETVRRVTILGNREPNWPKGFSVLEGLLEFHDKDGKRIWLDEQIADNPKRDFDFRPDKPIRNVRSIRFTSTKDEGDQNGYKDIAVGEIQIE